MKENNNLKDLELYNQFKNNLVKYDDVLNKMELQVIDRKPIDIKSKIDTSKLLKILNSNSLKILYAVMFLGALLLNPPIASLMTLPIAIVFGMSLMIKIVRALHETFSQIIYLLLGSITILALVYYLFLAINVLKYFRTIWI